jgi:hypothetical protein
MVAGESDDEQWGNYQRDEAVAQEMAIGLALDDSR